MPYILAIILFLLALILFWIAQRQRQESGLPAGRIIYADTNRWQPQEKPLYDRNLGLAGKPDYLVQDGDQLIPVEVKSSRAVSAPYDAHIYQLAAYCLLVESEFGKRPSYGILHYPNRSFAIDFTEELEADLLSLLDEMRHDERRRQVDRSHQQPQRCAGCGFRSLCDQRLEPERDTL